MSSHPSAFRPVHLGALAALGAALLLSACGGGSNSSSGTAKQTYTVGGTLSDLNSPGLVLANGNDTLTLSPGATRFILPTALASGATYAVTISTQPTGETCTVASGSGTISSANVANVVITCSDQAYSLGGSIAGLGSNSGLVLANGSDTLAVAAGATTFTLPTPVAYTSTYAVTVKTQPTGLTCNVSNGTGTMPANAVTNVSVTCTAQSFTLGGTVSGLGSSTGLKLTDGTDTLAVAAGATSFALPTALTFGTTYAVTVSTQPTGETCTVASGNGTISSANVANVVVTCSDQAYSLGGTISGLGSNSGLVLANGSDTLTVAAGATSFTLPTPVAYTSSYAVTVKTQPAGLTCTVGNGTGTMPANAVTQVSVTCTDQSFTLGGTISGLGSFTGLVLTDGTDTLAVSAGASSFTFPTVVAFGTAYSVSVATAPAGLSCSVSNSSGTMGAANVTSVVVVCSDQAYSLGGTISGLTTSGLVLANGSDTRTVTSGATGFTMPTSVAYTSSYAVLVQTQPTGQTCTVANGSGTMGAGNVTTVSVTCALNTYTIGGTISGLTGTGLVLLNNSAAATAISANATQFTLNTGMTLGNSYAITVQTQPAGETCTVSNGSGTVGAADVTSITISCAAWSTYTFSLLHSFAGGSGDGANPGGLLLTSDGNLYGTTSAAGANNDDGTVFKITPSGTETVLYSFAGATSDGQGPGGLFLGSDGNFYGTTASGGANNFGTVFKLTAGGTETVLYSFAGGSSDGANPTGLIQGSDGNFYGTTGSGGANNFGTVFKLTPGGTETVLYSFAGGSSDGFSPTGLIQGSDGNFYGTTVGGGTNDDGTVFKLTPGGTETVLHSLAGSTGAGLIQGSDGNFYGTTVQGGANNGGTVFKVTPSGTLTVLYSFAGSTSDGSWPSGNLLLGSDGNFYGTSVSGGTYGNGTVFKLTPSGTETVLYSFAGGTSDGAYPGAGLIQDSDGNFYGTTPQGSTNNYGIVFKITPR